ncbi:hypothetical protein KUCAC02_010553 [Chaenocephalus aceratus]|uniref:Uncharacterized protein n=1 Tax=Chaenocephalus aceratus TaxID=36190 RepID=A0ACB9VZL9_CHAAC|nr:hypothetical protein KUCAC02_010553 [Chaenocephalus aceratus]
MSLAALTQTCSYIEKPPKMIGCLSESARRPALVFATPLGSDCRDQIPGQHSLVNVLFFSIVTFITTLKTYRQKHIICSLITCHKFQRDVTSRMNRD